MPTTVPTSTSTSATTSSSISSSPASSGRSNLTMEAVVEFDYSAQEVDELTIRKGDVITDIRMQPGGWWEGCVHGRRGMFPDNFVKVRNKSNSNSSKETMANNEVQLRASSGRRCKVLFSYQPANDDELELQVNDVIEVLDEVEEGWWRGKLRNRMGVFPSNFVTEVTEKQANGGPGSRKTSATQPPPLSMVRKEEISVIPPVEKVKGVIMSETDSPASPTGPDSGNPKAIDVDAPLLPPKPVKELCKVLYPYEAANEDELNLKEGDIVTIVTKDVQDKGWWKGELRGHIGLFPDNFVVALPPEETPQAKKPERPPPAKSVTSVSSIKSTDSFSKSINSTGKKTSENSSKPDEKAPPVLSKKPALPPASKKPQLRTPTPSVPPPINPVTASKRGGTEVADSPEQRLNDLVDGTASSKIKITSPASADTDFDGVERGAMLTHPTASRAKAPRRRLPTGMLNKEVEPAGGMTNGNGESHNHSVESNFSLDECDRENGFESGTPGSVSSASSGTTSNRNSKEWEKNKAPWMAELIMNQAAKKSQGVKTPPAPSPPKPDSARIKKEIPDSPASPTSPEPPKINAVTVRQNSATNNSTNHVSNIPSSVSAASRPQSVHGEIPANRLSGTGSRPNSMYAPAANDKNSTPSSNSIAASIAASTAGGTVPMKQFLELVDKVSKLESHCDLLKRTVTELSLQLKEEKEKRFQMQQEIVKLTDLVTQV
ncbi:hypothetical protein FOCC_FOCC007685 [Frankliniella occidentalis]|nr:SH3 domain-containing kinase-binding protein 1 isoform X3 [Frankliniella occidentalis]KAE8745574.1 hypothetical protein FOCC_FOCC007685 [Frankliniella occidentalis]